MNFKSVEPLSISIRPVKLATSLAIVSVFIAAIGAIAHIVRHQVIVNLNDPRADLLRRLDIVEEPSLSQWYSSALHLSAAFLTVGIAVSLGRRMFWRWIGLSVLFTYASMDEAIMIHEMMDRPVREYFGTSGYLTIAWIIPGAFIALLIGIGYVTFLWSLTFRIAGLFFAGGVVFLCGAILMEIPGGYYYEKYGFASWHYIATYAIEETLEMLGVIIFLYGLLCFVEEATRRTAGVTRPLSVLIGERSQMSVEV